MCCSYIARGGAAGIRTPDLRRARAALSQTKLRPPVFTRLPSHLHGVGAPGFEPGTSALSGPRSNRLSYAPVTGVLSVRCMLFAHKSPCAEDEAKPNVRNRYPQISHTAPHEPMRLCQAVRHTVTTTSSRPVPPSMVQRAMLDHRVSAETDLPVSLERR